MRTLLTRVSLTLAVLEAGAVAAATQTAETGFLNRAVAVDGDAYRYPENMR